MGAVGEEGVQAARELLGLVPAQVACDDEAAFPVADVDDVLFSSGAGAAQFGGRR